MAWRDDMITNHLDIARATGWCVTVVLNLRPNLRHLFLPNQDSDGFRQNVNLPSLIRLIPLICVRDKLEYVGRSSARRGGFWQATHRAEP